MRNLRLKWLGTQFHYRLDDILDCGLGNFIGFIMRVKWMMEDSRRRLISIEDFNNRPTLWSPNTIGLEGLTEPKNSQFFHGI